MQTTLVFKLLPAPPSTCSTTAKAAPNSSAPFTFMRTPPPPPIGGGGRRRNVFCQVALKPDLTTTVSADYEESIESKIGSRVRVKAPLKVYHVPKVSELDLCGMEGVLKQYVGIWKGKPISANLPFKIEFFTQVPGRGLVKFFAHLKEDEFDYLTDPPTPPKID